MKEKLVVLKHKEIITERICEKCQFEISGEKERDDRWFPKDASYPCMPHRGQILVEKRKKRLRAVGAPPIRQTRMRCYAPTERKSVLLFCYQYLAPKGAVRSNLIKMR